MKAGLHICDSDNRSNAYICSNERTAEELLEELSKGIESIRIEGVLSIEEAFAGLEDLLDINQHQNCLENDVDFT